MSRFSFFIACLLMFVVICPVSKIEAQVFMQLELKNDPETIKFRRGDLVTFKTKSQPKDWITREIVDIKVAENIVVFEDGFRHLDELIAVRLHRKTFDDLTRMVQKFAIGWFVIGILALLVVPGSTIPLGALVISSVSFYTGGWLLNKLFKYRVVKLGNRYRLRLLDLRFP